MTIEPFRVEIDAEQIADLNRRIDAVRWPSPSWEARDDWSSGTPEPYLREFVDYWRNSFDWDAAQERLNQFDQFTADVSGRKTHFIHARSPHPEATPLLLVHGWPGSVVEFFEVIPRLTDPTAFGGSAADAYHVVAPSLPGCAWSAPATEPGMSPAKIAGIHAELMELVGYDRYVAQGGDWGAVIVRCLADIASDKLIGIHVNLVLPIPPQEVDDPEALLSDEDKAYLAHYAATDFEISGYSHIQGSKPLTLGYGMSDSAVGQAAWILEKFYAWTDNNGDPADAIDWDTLLTNISVYWLSGCFGSAANIYKQYRDAITGGLRNKPRVTVPTGVANYPKEIWHSPRPWIETEYNLVHWADMPAGGHFAALEQPQAFAEDLWSFRQALG
ncbi:MAG: alpha/beta fold hydrolase [Nocardioidaceae bacterium]|nr:MAG: alpha/beta fold hydrolase [Nocardioidaceae bacterium]